MLSISHSLSASLDTIPDLGPETPSQGSQIKYPGTFLQQKQTE